MLQRISTCLRSLFFLLGGFRIFAAVAAVLFVVAGRPLTVSAAISFDASSYAVAASGSHTISGSDTVLLVFASCAGGTPTGATFNGVGMTSAGAGYSTMDVNEHTYYMMSPASGTHTVDVTCSGGTKFYEAASYDGVDTTNTGELTGSLTSGAGADPWSLSITSTAANSWIVGWNRQSYNDQSAASPNVERVMSLGDIIDSNAPVVSGAHSLTWNPSSGPETSYTVGLSLAPYVPPSASELSPNSAQINRPPFSGNINWDASAYSSAWSTHGISSYLYFGTYPDTSTLVSSYTTPNSYNLTAASQMSDAHYLLDTCAGITACNPYTYGVGTYWSEYVDQTVGTAIWMEWTYDGVNVIPASTTLPDVTTHISSVTPSNGSTVSTSTPITIAVSGYINEPSFPYSLYQSDKVVVQITHSVNSSNVFSLPPASSTIVSYVEFKYPTGATGAFSFSTSTTALSVLGEYSLESSIVHTSFGLTTFVDVSTTTTFTVGTTSPADAHAAAVDAYFASVSAGTSAPCDFTAIFVTASSTALGSCLKDLIVPTSAQWNYITTSDAIVGFENKIPFGYIPQMYHVFFDTATSSMPVLSYTFGSSSPSTLWGTTITFDPFNHMDTLNTIYADDGSGKNIWDIVDPYFVMIVSVSVFLVMLADLFKIELTHDNTQVSDSATYSTGVGLDGGVMITEKHTVNNKTKHMSVSHIHTRRVSKSKRRY